MAREDRLDAIGLEQSIEISPLTGDRDLVSGLRLLTREIDGRVDMAVQPARMVQQMENTHDSLALVSDPSLGLRWGPCKLRR
ncbi:hypothetical protein MRA01_12620 [Methylobacterium radiotolerans]|nr:hypothetical protein MRA01_12620 [Methylobacterium radiotolerans]